MYVTEGAPARWRVDMSVTLPRIAVLPTHHFAGVRMLVLYKRFIRSKERSTIFEIFQYNLLEYLDFINLRIKVTCVFAKLNAVKSRVKSTYTNSDFSKIFLKATVPDNI